MTNGIFHKATDNCQDGLMYILMGYRLQFPKNTVFLSPKIAFVLANCADSDEMLHYSSGSSLFVIVQI